jgi:hypothetical protein
MDPRETNLVARLLPARLLQAQTLAAAIARAPRLLWAAFRWIGRAALVPFAALIRCRRRRIALDELPGLSPRILKDTGLHRGELWFIADAYARSAPYDRDGPRPQVDPGTGNPSEDDSGVAVAQFARKRLRVPRASGRRR